jgi:hypothetical protein
VSFFTSRTMYFMPSGRMQPIVSTMPIESG